VNDGEVHSRVIVLGFIRLLLININISTMFYWDFISNCCVRFNLRRGVVVIGSLVNSLVSSLVSSLVGSLVSSLNSSSSSSLLGSSGLGYRYSFTVMVLKLVGLLGSYTLYISLLILSNLNGLVYLPLYLVLPLCYTSTSKLRGRLWIMVTNGLFCWFSVLLTYFFALILMISSIAFFIAAARCVIEGAGGLSSLI